MKRWYLLLLSVLLIHASFGQKSPLAVCSPNGKLQLTVTLTPELTWSLSHNGQALIEPSPISITLADSTVWGGIQKAKRIHRLAVNRTVEAPFYRNRTLTDQCNTLTIDYANQVSVEFRVYDQGAAYRFVSHRTDAYQVAREEARFRFAQDGVSYCPYSVPKSKDLSFENQYFTTFENHYKVAPLSQTERQRLIFLPLLVTADSGKRVCITESDLRSYPGMFLNPTDAECELRGVFAPLPEEVVQGGSRQLQGVVKTRKSYLAQIEGSRTFPWRIAIVSTCDTELPVNDLVYLLAEPSRIENPSWIEPGKVAWEWWNDWGLYHVDFKAGVNNATYKHYIDFAAEYGIEYIILDAGWSVAGVADLMQVVPEIDLTELVAYGKARNVGLILWAGYWAFHQNMEQVCAHYANLGIRGFKIDYMDRDDQQMVEFCEQAAATCAKYHLIVDFHGVYKPTGLSRTYPNILNYEGVNGLEQMKWAGNSFDQVTYDVTLPFIRQVAGPMDYTPGAMRNSARRGYQPNYTEPMSQGTRCRQLALYIVLDAPLNMMSDSPENYRREEECARFIAGIPTLWSQSRVLQGEVGEYIVMARHAAHANQWFLGGITSWTSREVALKLDFLPAGTYNLTLFRDGINADRIAQDYQRSTQQIQAGETLTLHLAPGGGFAAQIEPVVP
ncbi:MAG: glycoside hydrolase family 97 protein [Alistipes sp.]|nr:glycoside hydrolase family 97 protein [Alistipes sp.]